MNLELKDITYSYKEGIQEYKVLDDINYTFEAGNFYTIMGPSGAGKTTLLSIASGLTRPIEGSISYQGKNIYDMGITNYRKKFTSIIFQAYNLIPYMTAFQNVKVGMEIKSRHIKNINEYVKNKLKSVGITEELMHKNVMKLSGGQQQRVAVARALSADSSLIFADEPTGNLDQVTSKGIIDMLKELALLEKKCVIMVTHDLDIAKQADISLVLKDNTLQPLKRT
ncbi:ABC transporter ATP-binding protein [Enterococcus ureasiticus]|uniref:ABC transporter ATP-binding protein n=1 Tax=Enterococcus ureasiticus TaxID=903984 RepID=UPI001A8E280D|nr:ABC transporter ATP-binding protein [Enterococcus ureasiticus]MBO0473744.1 ABC transporter ATP-binding protein [Enterococcus ureasiticus]